MRRSSRIAIKLSTDPNFVEKLNDIVGLYVDPPAHAIVLSIDEKSQIQALDRSQPGLPLKAGRRGTVTHDYKRHGTTTLFAALDVLAGKVIGQNMQRDRHQEFIRFLNTIERQVPAGKVIHAIADNYAAHKLQAAINRFIAETNNDPKPFVWTADPDRIIAAVRRGRAPSVRVDPLEPGRHPSAPNRSNRGTSGCCAL